jgi:hypothetical protein
MLGYWADRSLTPAETAMSRILHEVVTVHGAEGD